VNWILTDKEPFATRLRMTFTQKKESFFARLQMVDLKAI
jgi:hypothetical protein